MKIAFISLNQEKMPSPVVPLGLLYVMANTPQNHEKELWDVCFEKKPIEYIKQKIENFRPDIIAIGIRNLQNSTYTDSAENINYYKDTISGIRQISKAVIILGGSAFSVMPEKLMNVLRPDYGISGEGEKSFAELLNTIESKELENLNNIHCLHWFENNELHSNTKKEFLNLNELKAPDKSLVDKRYYEFSGTDSIQTNRGCPLKCEHCTYPIIEGRQKRSRDAKLIVDELINTADKNPQIAHFFIVDSVFNLPLEHAKDICREMISRNFNIPWTAYVNPIGFDEELAELMVKANCAGFECGSDSGCDDILKKLNKGFDTKQILNLSQICKKNQLKDCHTFMLGTPTETLDHVKRTIDFIIEMNPASVILMIWKDDYELLEPSLAQERRAFRKEIEDLLYELKDKFPRWIIPTLGINFNYKMFRYLRHLGLKGPLWQHQNLDAMVQNQQIFTASV
ncbi:MAG: radical SAM protein [Spirochaetia bacterium]|nr:radical SAM protein [Spirochaetia bacterium]